MIIRVCSLLLSLKVVSKTKAKGEVTSIKIILQSVYKIVSNNKTIVGVESLNNLTFFIPIIYQIKLLQLGYNDSLILLISLLLFLVMYVAQKGYSSKKIQSITIKNATIIQVLGVILLIPNNILVMVLGLACIYATIPLKTQLISELKHSIASNSNRSTLLSGYSLITLITSTTVFSIVAKLSEYNISLSLIVLSVLIATCAIVHLKKAENL
ncbi:MAG: hypothetical protein ACK5NF_08070 [Bacilli bacterium]